MANTEPIILDKVTDRQVREWEEEIKNYNIANEKRDILSTLDAQTQYQLEVAANYLLNKANNCEKSITDELNEFVDKGISLVELDQRIKGKRRLKEKIYSKNIGYGDETYIETTNYISDTLRYTYVIDDKEYVSKMDNCLHSLEEDGYKVINVDNRWGNLLYRGINVKIENQAAFKFEIQFHNLSSYYVKEDKSRELYNLLRTNTAPIELIIKADLLRRFYQKNVVIPNGALNYQFESNSKKL